jgi:glycosyltransferase involved in cell wall biosynthesis
MRVALMQARHCFFVSRRNLKLTEEQFSLRLPHATIVRNPFKVSWDRPIAWPDGGSEFRFACVGRLYPMEKGQDILIRVLAMEKWRNRPVSLTFFGNGEQSHALAEMAAFHGLDNVRFAGFADDVEAIWKMHHALLLASRAEGLPLVLVEAMLCGRVPIVTDVGGNREVLDDNVSGFVAAAPTEEAIDEAMERAWQRRGEWPDIGRRAAESIRRSVSREPARDLAGLLLDMTRDRSPLPSAAAAHETQGRVPDVQRASPDVTCGQASAEPISSEVTKDRDAQPAFSSKGKFV